MAKTEKTEKISLAGWLIEKIDTKDWRIGKVTGVKHPKVQQRDIDRIGKRELLEQAMEMQEAGLLTIHWLQYGNDIAYLDVPVESMEGFCQREGIENPRSLLQKACEELKQWKEKAPSDWHKEYYDDLLMRTEKGNIPAEMQDTKLFQILNAIYDKEKTIWKRVFSAEVLDNSKEFETKYQRRIVTILRNYAPIPDKEMEEDEILAEFGILTYSQRLEWKGAVRCLVADEKAGINYKIDTSNWSYGYVMNAQSLEHAKPLELPGVRRIVTIENKANYESMSYNPEVLYIFCHGFFSPKERRFLKKLSEIAEKEVEFYHWSDMDYGGIRIFQFMRKRIFPEIRPMHMSLEEYEKAVQTGKGIALTAEKREKLKQMEAGILEELKQKILEKGIEIEQELLL